MCGIFGWAGKDPKRFNRNKLNTLGIMNEIRGVHSCGISKDGEIVVGINEQKLFRDFLADSGYNNPKKYPVVIGHTRQSTFGAHTVANAHPFGFGTNKEGEYKLIGVHNGTLTNHPALAKEYNIETTVENGTSASGTSLYRTKIDSEVLLEILSETKNFKVLSKYNGAAALVWTDTDEPNVIYCYHGKSKKRDYDTSEEEIERPLFYFQEGKNSAYISSIQSSLFVIGATAKTIGEFDTNTIYKITDGNIASAEKTVISRSKCFITGVARTPQSSKNYGRVKESNSRHAIDDDAYQVPISDWRDRKHDRTVSRAHQQATNKELQDLINNNIYTEAPAENANFYAGRIYLNKLRHWRNGHKINGIYTFIDGFGFYYVGESVKDATDTFYGLTNKPFFDGEFVELKKVPKKHQEGVFYPFIHRSGEEITNPPLYYFYEGIRIRTASDYIACISTSQKNLEPFTYEQLSYCAAHPIMDISAQFRSYDAQEILLDGKLVTDTICPLGAEKVYEFKNGNCYGRQVIKKYQLGCKTQEESREPNQFKMELVVNNLEKLENDISEEEAANKLPAITNHLGDLLDSDLDDMFKDVLQKFPSFIKRLDKYSDIKATRAQGILRKVVHEATKLITIEIKE